MPAPARNSPSTAAIGRPANRSASLGSSSDDRHLEHPEPFGPWALDIDPSERRCRWRALSALALVYCGHDSELARHARASEHDDDGAAERAWAALLAMPPLPRRRLLSAWGALNAAMAASE